MKFYKLVYDDEHYENAINVGDDSMHIGACSKYGLKHPFIWKDREEEKGNRIIDLPSLRIGDFVAPFGCTYWMITDEVAQLLKEQGFTGYELRPVKVNEVKKMKKGQSIPKIWQLVITGWGGIAPPESGLQVTFKCEVCHYWKYSGLSNPSALIDPSQWDSSDFFMVYPLAHYIFVTERVKHFVEEKGLKGCLFREPKDIEPFSETSGGPYLLYYCMPKLRAKEIGEPLGLYGEPPAKGTEEYKAMREALLKIYYEHYKWGRGGETRIVYLEDEDGYLIEPKID